MSADTLRQLVADLIVAASALSGYLAPADSPNVVLVPHEVLEEKACGQPCRVYGWSPPGATIYLDSRLDLAGNLFARSILVHELTHYLQQESGKYSTHRSCREWVEREREAYLVQFRWLAREQGGPVTVPPEMGGMPWQVRCEDETESGNGGLGG